MSWLLRYSQESYRTQGRPDEPTKFIKTFLLCFKALKMLMKLHIFVIKLKSNLSRELKQKLYKKYNIYDYLAIKEECASDLVKSIFPRQTRTILIDVYNINHVVFIIKLHLIYFVDNKFCLFLYFGRHNGLFFGMFQINIWQTTLQISEKPLNFLIILVIAFTR